MKRSTEELNKEAIFWFCAGYGFSEIKSILELGDVSLTQNEWNAVLGAIDEHHFEQARQDAMLSEYFHSIDEDAEFPTYDDVNL